ncbi:hypothetical protein PV326_006111, partial [Microctonus aethiopoides]
MHLDSIVTNYKESLMLSQLRQHIVESFDYDILRGNNEAGALERMLTSSLEKPDPDTIKMFVGQVPHDMEENDLRVIFEEFGRVHQINVLRNKYTGTHQGCCFVTFYTRKAALAAQNALHNIKTFNG